MTVTPGPARTITDREWQLIARDPGGHRGEKIVVYGQVTQFDSVTGQGSFRANVGGTEKKLSRYSRYADYDTNTYLVGDPDTLRDVVQYDLFRAEVVVMGTMTYTTTLGGQMTVPQLLISDIVVTGSPQQ